MSIQSYQDLVVWQKSMDLVTETYRLTKKLPKEELFALSEQMRKAAVAIPSSIAEGQARTSTREFLTFLSKARGENAELETQLMICVRLEYLPQSEVETANNLCQQVGKMLNGLIYRLTTP